MTMEEYISEIKLELTGGVLELELPDEKLAEIVNKAVREVQRYIDMTKLITIPYSRCIDMSTYISDCSSVLNVYRTDALGDLSYNGGQIDPFTAQFLMTISSSRNGYTLSNFLYNYGAWSTLLQMRNTLATDLEFREDKLNNQLYVYTPDYPSRITVEYIPKLKVEQITSDYWIDIVSKLSISLTKIVLGRIRSKYKTDLFELDGQQLLDEGLAEVESMREMLLNNSQLPYAID